MRHNPCGADALGRPCTFEPLEGRCLLSASVESTSTVEPAVVPPAVRMLGRPLVTGGTHYGFSLVVWSGSPSIDGDDFVVRGPNGFEAPVEVTRRMSGRTASLLSCRVDAPGAAFDRSDNGLYTLSWRWSAVAPAGVTSSSSPFGRFRVFSSAPPEAAPTLPLSDRATAGALTVVFNRMGAWCDHMPVIGPDGARRHLIVETILTNHSDAPLEVTLSRAYISFDENEVGQETHGISIRSPHGPPTGIKTLVLQPGETRVVQYRGTGVYPEDRHGQRMYVTLEFTADGATAAVRNSGVVMVTH